ncbi:hypothetical protein CBL_01892 [Carabus blaptoides fortunei]
MNNGETRSIVKVIFVGHTTESAIQLPVQRSTMGKNEYRSDSKEHLPNVVSHLQHNTRCDSPGREIASPEYNSYSASYLLLSESPRGHAVGITKIASNQHHVGASKNGKLNNNSAFQYHSYAVIFEVDIYKFDINQKAKKSVSTA